MDRIPEPELMDLPHEAQAYADADFSQVNEAFVQRLLALAGPLGRVNALDLGTGPCDIPLRLWRQRDWRIAAVDAAFAMLQIGVRIFRASQCLGPIRPILSDAKVLPFASDSFDIIFSNSILHHLGEPERLWAEVARVAKQGVLVFLRDLARPASQSAARRIVEEHAGNESALLQEEYYRSLLAAYTPDEVRCQLNAAGLPGLEVAMVTDRHFDVWGRL
jgi:ubiquinone/menaquinone biosynthesis C-methylase UbiE